MSSDVHNIRQMQTELRGLLTPLSESLKSLQTLRYSVDSVFSFITAGYSEESEDETQIQFSQNNFLQNLKDSLHRVDTNFGILEKSIENLPGEGLKNIHEKVPPLAYYGTLSLDQNNEVVKMLQDIRKTWTCHRRLQGIKNIF